MASLNQERLREVLDYCPGTGVFHWRVKTCRKVVPGSVAGGIGADGYTVIGIDSKTYRGHRLAFLWMTGRWPIGVDHADGDRVNNAWTNIREAGHAENGQNLKRLKRNTSGHIGVSQAKNGRWRAQISVNRCWFNLGLHDTPDAAARAYAAAKSGLHKFNPTIRGGAY